MLATSNAGPAGNWPKPRPAATSKKVTNSRVVKRLCLIIVCSSQAQVEPIQAVKVGL